MYVHLAFDYLLVVAEGAVEDGGHLARSTFRRWFLARLALAHRNGRLVGGGRRDK